MTFLQELIIAIVQGITEFLPISSSGHLILIPKLTDFPDQGPLIDVAVHVGSLLAIILYFRKDVIGLARGGFASVGLGKVREHDGSYGYNAQTEAYGDMVEMGIIDPAKVTRSALQNAGSIAGMILTTEVMIADRPEPKGPAMPAPGMDDF